MNATWYKELEKSIAEMKSGLPVWKELAPESNSRVESAYYIRIGEFVVVYMTTRETHEHLYVVTIPKTGKVENEFKSPPTTTVTGTIGENTENEDWWVQYKTVTKNSVKVVRQWDSGNWGGGQCKFNIVMAGERANSSCFP